jgi:hypothetical protein
MARSQFTRTPARVHAQRMAAVGQMQEWTAEGHPAIVTAHEAWILTEGGHGTQGDHGTPVSLASLAVSVIAARRKR